MSGSEPSATDTATDVSGADDAGTVAQADDTPATPTEAAPVAPAAAPWEGHPQGPFHGIAAWVEGEIAKLRAEFGGPVVHPDATATASTLGPKGATEA